MSFPFNFENIFISIPLDISNIEAEKDSDIDELENFNIDIQIYLAFKRKHKEFTIIKVNFNIIKKDNEEHPYEENDPYLKPNNTRHYNITQMNYIYNYYIFHLKPKATNNFFSKTIFKLIKKIYKEKKTRCQIFTTRTTIYRTFTLSFEYPSIYIKEKTTLKRYQKSSCLEHYLKKAKK